MEAHSSPFVNDPLAVRFDSDEGVATPLALGVKHGGERLIARRTHQQHGLILSRVAVNGSAAESEMLRSGSGSTWYSANGKRTPAT